MKLWCLFTISIIIPRKAYLQRVDLSWDWYFLLQKKVLLIFFQVVIATILFINECTGVVGLF